MALRDDCHRYIRHGVNNGGRDDWRSPRKLVESLDNEFDFTIDLAADNNNRVCDRYYSEQDNALLMSWKDERGFCNPPFSKTESPRII
ncbi:phage N-6-adenine-methyltransferase [Raoultella terrigena]|uniref:phage N-6-adenine-methyltransferase n=1 Tax=Raoultella terrigena TaxID=577 RepID=UPI001D0DAB03|nr:phage N-6-adenine-methyltransferase [Raoultella terrigena]